MAIPFFEPRPSESAPQGDQVDGHGGTPPPDTSSINITTSSNSNNFSINNSSLNYSTTSTPTPSTDDFSTPSTDDSSTPSTPTSSTFPSWLSEDEQLLAWKILAVAMCKALKEYHLQSTNTKDAFTSANGSVVQVMPNGEVHPIWK